jgi:choline dehydrogenase-like flavoprotein
MSQLDLADRIRYLERRWRDQVGTLRGLGFRMLLLALRAAYLSDPKVFEAIGCDYYKPAVTPSSTPRWQQQILHGRDIDAPLEFEAEVVVVGTGAGGAVIACELARQGNAVVMVEAGEHFTREQFNGRPYEMQRLMYAHRGLTVSLGNASVVVPYGETVGGTTTINSGTCFRPPERTLRRWQRDHGLSDYTPEMLAPYLDRAEHGFEVATADMKVIGPNGAVAARGADALGLSHHPLRRNATDCDGQSVCCYGCPTDAKRSTNVTYVPKALQSGAQLLCRVRADEVLLGGGEVRGLRGHSLDTGQAVTIKAPVVVPTRTCTSPRATPSTPSSARDS